MTRTLTKGVIYSFISALSFATLAILIKIGYNSGLKASEMLLYRFFFATLTMGGFFLLTRPYILKPTPKLILKSAFTGSVLYTAQAFCFFKGIKYVSPNVVELILYLYPAAVTLISYLVFKERITFWQILFIGIILLGFGFIFHDAFRHKLKLLGIAYAFSAMLIYSTYLIFVQTFVKNENPIAFSFYTILFAFISFLIISLNNFSMPKNIYQLAVGVLLGLIPTFSAIMFLFLAIELIGSALASVFSSVEPVFTIIMAYIFLHISLNKYQFIGGFLIIAGVILENLYHSKRSHDV